MADLIKVSETTLTHRDNVSDDFKDGYAAFLCDVCELWYNTTDLGWIQQVGLVKREVCVECVEYVGGDYV
jgi:hypothetical protein